MLGRYLDGRPVDEPARHERLQRDQPRKTMQQNDPICVLQLAASDGPAAIENESLFALFRALGWVMQPLLYSKKRPHQDSNLCTLLRRPSPHRLLTCVNILSGHCQGRSGGAA
jgi:hypothetical protein